MARLNWPEILTRAASIVRSYDTGVTLRQLFYRLVSDQTLPNTDVAYRTLSARTAAARRAGTFPSFIDQKRGIRQRGGATSPAASLDLAARIYRRDRTEGQEHALYLAVEKAGLVEQVADWFGDLGVPILAVGGYSSQTYVDDIRRHVRYDGRPAILLYAGDYDPTGEDIDRDLVARTDCWAETHRVALTQAQVAAYRLPPNPGKATDSRAKAFTARNGELVQVEVDALDPTDLRALFQTALTPYWDADAYTSVVERERAERQELLDLAADFRARQ